MTHNTQTCLKRSNSPEMKRWWARFCRSACRRFEKFDDLERDRRMQELGVDLRVHLDDGTSLLWELKAESKYRSDEILIEFVSVYRESVEALGWVTKLRNSDRLAFGWPTAGKGFLLDSASLADAWEKNTLIWQRTASAILAYQTEQGLTQWDFPPNAWIQQQVGEPVSGNRFRFVEAANRSDFGLPYVTSSLVVPVAELVRCRVKLKPVWVGPESLN